MTTAKRIPLAPQAPLPELIAFLEPFLALFRRPESQAALERYLTGLLSEHPNKNCATLAALVPATSEQQLQGLLTQMVWDEAALNRQRVARLQALPSEGDAVLIVDDTGFAKQGRHSVGVARQYSGTLGKVANCQVTVNCHYAERTLAWPVATRLYLPAGWAADAARRARAQVPPAVGFQTKVDIALGLLDQAAAWGVRHACVVADADYGDNPVFLNGLEARGERYVVAVCSDFRAATTRRTTDAGQHIAAVLDALPRAQWQTVRWREGSRGWLRAKCIAGRGWRIDGDGTRHIGWLIGQRPTRGAGEWKYYWSNCPAAMGLGRMIEYTHRRYWIEQFHEEAKGLLGWDQYQGRLWPGFHRNAVLVMLSYSFLVWWEWHQRAQRNRPGRPRRAFSPSAGSTALLARQHPPPGCGAAARASHP